MTKIVNTSILFRIFERMCHNRIKPWICTILLTSFLSAKGSDSFPTAPIQPTGTQLDAAKSSSSSSYEECDVIIVGGGPSGLATALALSHAPHNCKCVVLEANPIVDTYDPTKAFLYNVNSRGTRFTKRFPRLHQKLVDQGVESKTIARSFALIPGDPEAPLPQSALDVDQSYQSCNNTQQKTNNNEDYALASYWIPRHDFTKILKEEVEDSSAEMRSSQSSGSASGSAQGSGSAQVLMGQECTAILPSLTTKNGVEVVTQNVETNQITTYRCKLVVGADGYKSKVRDCMSHNSVINEVSIPPSAAPPIHSNIVTNFQSSSKWQNVPKSKFKVVKYKSPATGLRIKVLQFPPQFEIPYLVSNPNVEGNAKTLMFAKTHGRATYALRSIYTSPREYTSLGVLPVKDNTSVRPVNLITRPNHVLWTIKTGPEMKKWFQKAFPRFFQLSPTFGDALIPDKEWERFAKAQGTRFPHCQYTNGMALSSVDKKSGLVLVGDAMHSYPPDIGQGVNSGLLDVIKLDEMLQDVNLSGSNKEAAKESVLLGDALDKYERDRLPEVCLYCTFAFCTAPLLKQACVLTFACNSCLQVKALIRLARFGAPYQYRQPLRIDRIGRQLHMANLLLRTLLHKITFGFTPEPAIILARSQPEYTFRQVMRRADAMTFCLGTLSAWLIKRLVLLALKKGTP